MVRVQRYPCKYFLVESIENKNCIVISYHCYIRPLSHLPSHWTKLYLADDVVALGIDLIIIQNFINDAENHHSFAKSLSIKIILLDIQDSKLPRLNDSWELDILRRSITFQN